MRFLSQACGCLMCILHKRACMRVQVMASQKQIEVKYKAAQQAAVSAPPLFHARTLHSTTPLLPARTLHLPLSSWRMSETSSTCNATSTCTIHCGWAYHGLCCMQQWNALYAGCLAVPALRNEATSMHCRTTGTGARSWRWRRAMMSLRRRR